MVWDVFNVIGTIAFAGSGALVAMEEEFDVLGVFVLAFATAFGGGAIRNLLVGIPITSIWSQSTLFTVALVSTALIFCSPVRWIRQWERWGYLFDAIGLSAFAIQGALYAQTADHALSAVIVAAVLTGIGGGMVRDILAGRKPLVLRDEIYALWAILAGAAVWMGWARNAVEIYILFALVVMLRMASVGFHWRLPRRSLPNHPLS